MREGAALVWQLNRHSRYQEYVARDPNEGDWNRNCDESGEERVDPSNKRMGRGWLKGQPRNQKLLGKDRGRESE